MRLVTPRKNSPVVTPLSTARHVHATRIALAAALALGASHAMAQATAFYQTAPGAYTYQLPANATSVLVEMAGGSGGGGGGDWGAKGGDGAVGAKVSANVAVQGGEQIDITVAGGGRGGVVFKGSGNAEIPQWGADAAGGSGLGQGGTGAGGGGYKDDAYSGGGGSGGGASLVNINNAAFIRAGGGGGGGGGSWSMGNVANAAPAAAQPSMSGIPACRQAADGANGERTPAATDLGNGGGGGGGGGGYSGAAGAQGKSGHDQTRTATSGGAGGSCVDSDPAYIISAASATPNTAGPAGVGKEVNSSDLAAGNGTAGSNGWVRITPTLAAPSVSVTCVPTVLSIPGEVATCTIASNGPSPDGNPVQVSFTPPTAGNGNYTTTCASPVTLPANGATPATCTITAGPTLPSSPLTPTLTLQPGTGYTVDPQKGASKVTIMDAPAATLTCDKATLTDSAGQTSTCTVNLSRPATSTTTIQLTVTGDSARYSGCTGPLTIAAGASTATCVITATPNTVAGDGNAPVSIAIAPPSNPNDYIVPPGIPAASIQIQDDDSTHPPVTGATAVPTLGEWALILLSSMLAGFAALRLRRSRVR